MKLILFDIDGTLLSTQGLGAEALIGAVRDVFGVPAAPPGYSMAGKTDSQIVRELATAGGIPEDRILRERPRALARSAEILEAGFRDRPRGHLMPGIRALVERLHADPAWRVGLLTGNTRAGARHKVGHFGLWERFLAPPGHERRPEKFQIPGAKSQQDKTAAQDISPLEFGISNLGFTPAVASPEPVGAFGDEDEDRNALPAIALRRARELLGIAFEPRDAYVVGDTVRDFACARAGGLRSVLVATGGDRYETLAGLKPDLLFRSFADVDDAVGRLNHGS